MFEDAGGVRARGPAPLRLDVAWSCAGGRAGAPPQLKPAPAPAPKPKPKPKSKRNLKFLVGKNAVDPDGIKGKVIKTRNLGDDIQIEFSDGSARWYKASELRLPSEVQ